MTSQAQSIEEKIKNLTLQQKLALIDKISLNPNGEQSRLAISILSKDSSMIVQEKIKKILETQASSSPVINSSILPITVVANQQVVAQHPSQPAIFIPCYLHSTEASIGTCVGCGKFICTTCHTEVSGKNYCKKCVASVISEQTQKIEKLHDKAQQQGPMVFMNAGGASSSSTAAVIQTAPPPSQQSLPVVNFDKTTAALWGIFLGGFGAHKFYLGKNSQAIFYLLFCWTWIPAVVGFIEGIGYLIMSQEDFNAKFSYVRTR